MTTDALDLAPDAILTRIPQQEPFRFIDRIHEIDADHVLSSYRWRKDADFYRGHFPGRPVTPGVLLIECMAQGGVVPLGIYLHTLELGVAEASRRISFFTDANVEFTGHVEPGVRVNVLGKKVFFRRGKLRSEVEMTRDDGSVVAWGTLSGMGVET